MSKSSRDTFKLHLPGLLKVLAEHLYSNKQVAVRELIQNAHDTCVRRAVEGGESDYRPRIDISIEPDQRLLTISDNGFGLTEEEIGDYLATIGRSYTRELRENLSLLSPDDASQLIGQFGFGFLSAFLIASEVTVTTRSLRGNGRALRWHSKGDEYYEVEPDERAAPGTTIQLRIKPAASFVLRSNMLTEIVQQYADFLPIPIHLDDDPQPLNLMRPPWEATDVESATAQYIERMFHLDDPLCVIHLHDHTIELKHDHMVVPLRGFLFVPPASLASVREYGDMTVFIRHMFICRDHKELLPPWSRFVRGVIDCPALQPTASREDLHEDETFLAVQQALEAQLGAGLRRIAQEEPETWHRIVRGHADVIMGWAVRDNNFFEQVADIVTVRTSRGALSLPEYRAQSGGGLYFVNQELGSLQEQLLAEGHGIPVIDASWFAVRPFLEKYAARAGDIALTRLDGDAQALLRPVDEEPFERLLEYYRKRGVQVRVAAFNPREVPALLLYPSDAEFIHQARQSLRDDDSDALPGPLAGLVGSYVEDIAADRDDLQGTLYLNATCPLVRRLAESYGSEEQGAVAPWNAVLSLLFNLARLFAGRMMTAGDATHAFAEVTAACDALLE